MVLKKIGYYISKKRCVSVYALKKKNRSGKLVTKKVNYRGKAIKKGTKVYKSKESCLKALHKKIKRKTTKRTVKRTVKKSPIRKTKRKSRFGECSYSKPYFGYNIPSIGKSISGTEKSGYSSSSWKWPCPPGAKALDMQQGVYRKY